MVSTILRGEIFMGTEFISEKSKGLAIILSILIPGLGLLYADAGKNFGKFLFACCCSWLILPYLIGIFWSAAAVDQANLDAVQKRRAMKGI